MRYRGSSLANVSLRPLHFLYFMIFQDIKCRQNFFCSLQINCYFKCGYDVLNIKVELNDENGGKLGTTVNQERKQHSLALIFRRIHRIFGQRV